MIRGGLRLAARAVLLAGTLCLAVLLPAPAGAHSELQRSDPLDGAVVPVGRDTLTLWFGEPVAPASSTFVLRAEDGARIPVEAPRTAAGTTVVQLTTKPLTRQTYQLEWRVFSLDDGHTSSGTLTFGAGVRPDRSTSRGTRHPPVALFLVRWADLAALMVTIGALAVGDRVLRPLGARPRRRARTLAWVGALAAVYAGALTPFIRAFDLGQGPRLWWDQTVLTLTQTTWGSLWIAREASMIAALAAILVWRRRPERPIGPAVAAWIFLAAVAALEAWSGHASTLHDPARLTTVAGTAHLLAAGVWAGGLAVLVACVGPLLRSGTSRTRTLGAVWRTFSPLAAVSSVVLLATGLYEAGRQLPDLSATTSTLYGAAVAAKTALVVGALALAAANTLVVHPRVAARVQRGLPPRLSGLVGRRAAGSMAATVLAETVVLAIAVLLAAVLVTSPTAREEINARQPTTVHVERVDGLFVTFEEVAAGAGSGRLIVRVRAVVRPDPAPVARVQVDLSGRGEHRSVALEEVAPGRYEARTAEPGPGRWTAALRLFRSGGVESTARTSWTVPARASEAAGPLRVATTSAAALLLLALGLVLGRWRRSGRPRAGAPGAPTSPPDPERDRPRELSGSRR
jgi:copper transport protein